MKLSPISKYARRETRVCLRHFKTHLRHASKHPEDPDAIHDLRVSIRRLTQCFRIFRGLLRPGPVKELRRRLRAVMKQCGAVRNCDVALELLQESGIATGATVVKLRNKREDAAGKLRRHLKKERRRRHPALGAAVNRSGRGWQLDRTLEDNLRLLLPALAEDFFQTGAAATVAGASYASLHRFRLRAKRFRYTLERFERFYTSEMVRGAKDLKGLQDRLGAINDCVVTMDLLGRDRHATGVVGKLLHERKGAFQSYWRSRFAPSRLAWWKGWLARPVKDTS